MTSSVLTINGGSSSIRFAVYDVNATMQRQIDGKIDRIGLPGTTFNVNGPAGTTHPPRRISADRRTAANSLLDWLEAQSVFASVVAAGHRVVHGTKQSEPTRITAKLRTELHRVTPFNPDHLKLEVSMIDALARRYPKLPQVACFDSAFHRTMPRVAKLLPIPRRYMAKGVERYGFHGISYAYLMDQLGHIDPAAAKGRVILAHLGSGASLAAVQNGKSIDTSMGFTPTSGLVMSTRTGDLDPGLVYYLARTEHMTAPQFQQMVTRESGLLGVSGISSDLRDLLAQEAHDTRAADAVELFCYQAKKWIGSFAAALGGVETLVFSGGIGENAPTVRARICEGLEFLGIELDKTHNAKNAARISAGRVTVRVIPTDEELMIARSVCRTLRLGAHD